MSPWKFLHHALSAGSARMRYTVSNSTTTISLVRAMLRQGEQAIVPLVHTHKGRVRCAARLEVVQLDPSGSFTWTELHLGLGTRSGRLDFSGFARKDLDLSGYTRQVGKRQVLRTTASLLPWQEGNLQYAAGRLQRGAFEAPVAFEAAVFVSSLERQVTRRGPDGRPRVSSWLPRLLTGSSKDPSTMLGAVAEAIGAAGASDEELVRAAGGDPEKGLIPSCLVYEAVPEACLVDLGDYAEWTAVSTASVPGLIGWAEFQAREARFQRALESRREKNTSPSEEAGVFAGASAPEETQG